MPPLTTSSRRWPWLLLASFAMLSLSAAAAEIREEHFDREPAGWEGVNNHSTHFPLRTVTQDFGYSPSTGMPAARTGRGRRQNQPGRRSGLLWVSPAQAAELG